MKSADDEIQALVSSGSSSSQEDDGSENEADEELEALLQQQGNTRSYVTIYNEQAVRLEWSHDAGELLGSVTAEAPEWIDCSALMYHADLRRYSLCWNHVLILFDIAWQLDNDVASNRPALVQPTAVLSRGHSSAIATCEYVAPMRRLITCGTDRLVLAWVEADGWHVQERITVSCTQVSILYDDSSEQLFTGGTDGGVYVYKTAPFGQPIKRLSAHKDWVNGLSVIPELDLLVCCSADASISFFSTVSLSCEQPSRPQR